VTLEGYFEYVIAAYLNISRPLGDKSGEILGLSIGWYSAFLCFSLPSYLAFTSSLARQKVKTKEIRSKIRSNVRSNAIRKEDLLALLHHIFS